MVSRSNVLGSISDPECRLRLASRYSWQQAISGLRRVLGNRHAFEQLEEPKRRLCQSQTCPPYFIGWILRTPNGAGETKAMSLKTPATWGFERNGDGVIAHRLTAAIRFNESNSYSGLR